MVLWVTGSSRPLQGPRFQNRSTPPPPPRPGRPGPLILEESQRQAGLSSWPEKGQAWLWPRLSRAERTHIFHCGLQGPWFNRTEVTQWLGSSEGKAERTGGPYKELVCLTTEVVVFEAHLPGMGLTPWVTWDRVSAVSGPVSPAACMGRILPSIAPSMSRGQSAAKRRWLFPTSTQVTIGHLEFSGATTQVVLPHTTLWYPGAVPHILLLTKGGGGISSACPCLQC